MARQNAGAALPADGVLNNVRILDFGQYLAGPLAAMLLADHGADVIRIDPPGGPRWQHPANAILQRNKRSIVLDLRQKADLAVGHDLVASADVVIEGFRPGVLARLGLRPEEMCRANPRLIWCSIPGFGHDDPRAAVPGWEGIICAAAGLFPPSLTDRAGDPRFTAIPHASNLAAFIAAHSIVAALITRERTGRGDRIEVPLFDAAMEAMAIELENPITIEFERLHAMFKEAGIKNSANRRLYKSRDGRFVRRDIPLRGVHNFWDRYMPAGLKDDDSPEAVETAARLLEELFKTKDALEWERIGQEELRASFATYQTTQEWLNDEHAHDSKSVLNLDDPILGSTRQAGFGVRVSNCPEAIRFPRRELDADGAAIRAELAGGGRSEARQDAEPSPADAAGPLQGVKVLDFSSLLAGPGTNRILAEYGAEVIKINKAQVGLGRINPISDEPATFVGHRSEGAGKRTMFLDMRKERGLEILSRLLEKADIVSHNFAMGIAETLGIGEADLRRLRPNLIYSTINVHGRGGWRESYRGHEQIGQSVTGMCTRFGSEEAPEELAILNNDYGSGHLAAFGVLLSVLQRMRSGEGGSVESALSRTATLSQIPFMIEYEGQQRREPSGREAKGWGSLNRLYECADGWIYLAAVRDEEIRRLKSVEELLYDGEEPAALAASVLEKRFISQPRNVWIERLTAAGVPAHVYNSIYELLAQPILAERGLVVTKDHPGMSEGKVIGIVARFASMPNRFVAGAARPGWHSVEILQELGYGHNEIADFMESETVVGPMVAGSIIDPV